MKLRIIAMLLLLSLMFVVAAPGEEKNLPTTREDVETAVRELLKEPWFPSDALFNCVPVGGLWRAGLTRGNEALGELFVDGDREEFVACYRAAGYALPELTELMKNRRQASREDLEEGGVYRDEAEAIFIRLRGRALEPNESVCCEYRVSGREWLFGLEYPGEELGAVLILRVAEEDAPLKMLAYVDMHHNRDVRYPGCLSIDEAVTAAMAACEKAYGRETAACLQMENAAMVVGNAESYSMAYEETGIAPQAPFWTIALLDMRAQPDSLSYDEDVEYFRYHILVNPFDGEILEIWTEDFGWG